MGANHTIAVKYMNELVIEAHITETKFTRKAGLPAIHSVFIAL